MDMGLGNVASRIPGNPLGRISDGIFELKVLAEAGIIAPIRPDKLARMGRKFIQWGTSPAAAAVLTAIQHPDEMAVADELGTLTFAEVDPRSDALPRALAERGVSPGGGVRVHCRNHPGFIDSTPA